jgi:hypothetical protein
VVASVVAGDKTAWLRLIKWTIVRLANHIRSFTLTGQPLAYKVNERRYLPGQLTSVGLAGCQIGYMYHAGCHQLGLGFRV